MGDVKIAAIATRVTEAEREAIEALPSALGKTVADKLRALIRYSLDHVDDVQDWLTRTDGRPVDDD